MRHLKQCRALVRRLIRDARKDWTTCVYIRDCDENNILNDRQHEGEILDAIFNQDETIITFHNMTTGRELGNIYIVLDYESEPGEIINDYTANRYIDQLITKAESKL